VYLKGTLYYNGVKKGCDLLSLCFSSHALSFLIGTFTKDSREKPSLFRRKQLGDAFGGISSKYIIQFLIVIALNDMYQSLIWESANLYELLFLNSTDFKILYKASYSVI
jgi:hypothetical protein